MPGSEGATSFDAVVVTVPLRAEVEKLLLSIRARAHHELLAWTRARSWAIAGETHSAILQRFSADVDVDVAYRPGHPVRACRSALPPQQPSSALG